MTNFLKIAMDRTFLPGKNPDTISEKDLLHFETFLEKAVLWQNLNDGLSENGNYFT
jgi:hypothetical protein